MPEHVTLLRSIRPLHRSCALDRSQQPHYHAPFIDIVCLEGVRIGVQCSIATSICSIATKPLSTNQLLPWTALTTTLSLLSGPAPVCTPLIIIRSASPAAPTDLPVNLFLTRVKPHYNHGGSCHIKPCIHCTLATTYQQARSSDI